MLEIQIQVELIQVAVVMGKQERKEQGNEGSMMWSRFVAVQWHGQKWQLTGACYLPFGHGR